MYCTVLYSTVMLCTVLYCTLLYSSVLYCTVMYCMCFRRAEQSVATASAKVPADHAKLGGASCLDLLHKTGTHRGKCK